MEHRTIGAHFCIILDFMSQPMDKQQSLIMQMGSLFKQMSFCHLQWIFIRFVWHMDVIDALGWILIITMDKARIHRFDCSILSPEPVLIPNRYILIVANGFDDRSGKL